LSFINENSSFLGGDREFRLRWCNFDGMLEAL
jgi:hypothetical protein